jgi:AAA+ superfamily predicted ATPase
MVLHSAIAGYLLGESNIDTVLQGFARIFHGEKNIDELTLDDELKKSLSAILFELEKSITPSNGRSASYYYFYGPSGGGKKSTASALCLKLGLPLLIVDVASLLFRDIDTTMIVQSIVRQAILSPAGILFQYNDLLFTEDPKSVLLWRKILDETARVRIPLFFTGKTPRKFFDDGNDAQEISLEFPVPETGVRARIWGTATAAADIAICQDSVKTLADRYRFTPGRILSIVKSAVRDCAKAQDEQIKLGCLLHRCSATLAARLPRFATKITSPFSWNDLVLPASQKEMLHDICLHVHHQEKVFGEWGFNAKVATGQGINALFTGFSGTGKTMAAGILAKALVQDIYKIDLSLVVSKYIGETEKNLSTIFNEVDAGQAILFFDEADALFGKRSNVKDAHDRYANIEVAYLLQKMEEYQGITILATNLRQNMDEAFARRMHYIIEFPLPDRDDRERLWRNAFPAEAPLESLDFPFLARQFSITGANIKNIALAAALRAAEKKERIAMPHVLSAVRREYKKTGSFLSEDAVAYSGGNA